MLNMREDDIARADAEKLTSLGHARAQKWNDWMGRQSKKSALTKIGETLRLVEPESAPADIDIHAEVAKTRDPEDTKHLEEQKARREKIQAIARAAAQAQHDVEDLTAETIGDWKVPDFKGI